MAGNPPNPLQPFGHPGDERTGNIADLQTSVFSIHQSNLEIMRQLLDMNRSIHGMQRRLDKFELFYQQYKALDRFLRVQVSSFSANSTVLSNNLVRLSENTHSQTLHTKNDVTHLKELIFNLLSTSDEIKAHVKRKSEEESYQASKRAKSPQDIPGMSKQEMIETCTLWWNNLTQEPVASEENPKPPAVAVPQAPVELPVLNIKQVSGEPAHDVDSELPNENIVDPPVPDVDGELLIEQNAGPVSDKSRIIHPDDVGQEKEEPVTAKDDSIDQDDTASESR